MLPLYRWSGPDEAERQAAVRYWKRAIQIAVDLGVTVMNSEFSGAVLRECMPVHHLVVRLRHLAVVLCPVPG